MSSGEIVAETTVLCTLFTKNYSQTDLQKSTLLLHRTEESAVITLPWDITNCAIIQMQRSSTVRVTVLLGHTSFLSAFMPIIVLHA